MASRMILTSSRIATRRVNGPVGSCRSVATQTQKRAGDISDAFVSLSGQAFKPLPSRYAELKRRLISGNETAVQASWRRLLGRLQEEIPKLVSGGPRVVPEIQYSELDNPSHGFDADYKRRGVAVVRGVIPEAEALKMKEDVKKYINDNPHTKAFPADNPQVYELYWSPSQLRARADPRLLKAMRFLMSAWHSQDVAAPISTDHPTLYADRLRIRLPGDNQFALGPHVDGGSVERWEENGYGLGKVYDAVWRGEWERYDPWEASCRLPVQSDMHQGVGACSMFRMAQGWLAMSDVSPGEGTLLVYPLVKEATAYFLLRPFFEAVKTRSEVGSEEEYLDAANWRLEPETSSLLQGANPGNAQELTSELHPHLQLDKAMVHVPRVKPGDYVAWHCDGIHAVDTVHKGTGDSSVMYIPTCPLTEGNAQFLARQRQAYTSGIPCPDFGGGEGEANHKGRVTVDLLAAMSSPEGMRAFGLEKWDSLAEGLTSGQREVMDRANKTLGF